MSIEMLREVFEDIQARSERDLAKRFDASPIGKAAAIQQLTFAVDTYGFDTVAGWLRNIGHIHGKTVTVTGPEPGTIGDPRR